MSLPSTVRWDYAFQTEKGTEEAKLIEVLMNPKDWVQVGRWSIDVGRWIENI